MKRVASCTGSTPKFLAIGEVREADSTGGVLPDIIIPRQARRHQSLKVGILLAGRSSVEADSGAAREALEIRLPFLRRLRE